MSKILSNWIDGRGLQDILAIDGHIHINGWPHAETFRSVEEAVEPIHRYLDINGVDAFCALSGGYFMELNDYTLGNDFLLLMWDKLPDKLIPFMCVNANDNELNIKSEMGRMYSAGVKCIKLINHYQIDQEDVSNMKVIYEFAANNNMLIVNHSWTEDEIINLAKLYPSINFIFAHYGLGMDYQNSILNKYNNVFAIIWDIQPMGWLDRGLKNVGAKKFVFGSDGFLNSMSVGIGPVVFSNISDEEKQLILGQTLGRLLNNVGALPSMLQTKLIDIK